MEKFINKKVWEETLKSLENISEKYYNGRKNFYMIMTIFEIYQNLIDIGLIDVSDEDLEKLTNFLYSVYLKLDKITVDELISGVENAYNQEGIEIDNIVKMSTDEFLHYVPYC